MNVTTSNDHWAEFWSNKTDPFHSSSDEHHYDRIAAEIRLVLPDRFTSVLEVGCGNGCLYERLGFDKVAYFGIDYSQSMIASFASAFPDANVSVADYRSYAAPSSFDLIFSHGVVQYLTIGELEEQIAKAAGQLKAGGYIVHTGVLRKSCRNALMGGELWAEPGNWVKNRLRVVAEAVGLRRSMGYWHAIPDVRRISQRHGFTSKFFGSLLHPYRFHVVMQKVS